MNNPEYGHPVLYRKTEVPRELTARVVVEGAEFEFGGDVRLGDLNDDGAAELLIYRSAEGGMKPCFLAALTLEGEVLWTSGQGGEQPMRPGPMAIHDIDGDGRTEVICCHVDAAVRSTPGRLDNVLLQIRDGATGRIKREKASPELRACCGEGANWVHQRLLIANFRGAETPRDFVVKLGGTVLAFDQELELLWAYRNEWTEYTRCPAYIPCVGDIDGDGCDEVNGGYFLLDQDGEVLWEKQLGRNMDSVAIAPWDGGRMRAICSGEGHVVDERGAVILRLGPEVVPHGQEARVADLDPDSPGPDMVLRYNGHAQEVLVVNSSSGRIARRFRLNPTPNNTGMEAVRWGGDDAPCLLYNGGALWLGTGEMFAELPGLPEPVHPPRVKGLSGSNMGWYHCIPADVCGDGREEVVLYNPWDKYVYVYTPSPLHEDACRGYRPGPRQYNARIMD